jgi:tRNA (adenine22-N1)-methyltransferase
MMQSRQMLLCIFLFQFRYVKGGFVMKLGDRLSALAAMVPPGSRMADVGTDHAYLPLYLTKIGQIERAVAIDVNPGPFASARDAVLRAGMADRIDVRLGNGLQVVTPKEVDVAVMAGIGGMTMIQIMEENPAVTETLSRLVLQPMVGAPQVRRWLQSNGWRIIDETIVRDEGRLYEIVAAEPGKMEASELLEIGPILWQRRHPLLADLLKQRLNSLYFVLSQMKKSAAAQTNPKYQEQKAIISILEAKLACL